MTEYFPIQKGTRQGCPLSPLLFILTLEVLNEVIRNEEEIKGITLGRNVYKSRAFADDMIVMVENPINSINKLLEKMEKFGRVAGFKLNKDKTKIMIKNMNELEKKNLE